MTPISYIIEKIKTLEQLHPNVDFLYSYEKSSGFHIVEVLPDSIFENSVFCETLLKIYDEFYLKFLDDEILITKKSSTNDMSFQIYPQKCDTQVTVEFQNSPTVKCKDNSYIVENRYSIAA